MRICWGISRDETYENDKLDQQRYGRIGCD